MENNRYRYKPIYVNKFSPKIQILYTYDGERIDFLSQPLIDFLTACKRFLPLDQHAKAYWKKCSAKEKIHLLSEAMQFCIKNQGEIPFGLNPIHSLLTETLGHLLSRGLLFDLQSFKSSFKNISTLSPPITSLGIMTCNRPDLLQRSLNSYVNNTLENGRKVKFIIFDDSSNSNLVHQLIDTKKMFGVEIFYAGQNEKVKFVDNLMSQGLDEQSLRFALLGEDKLFPSYGANRNAFLLQTVSELAFSSDDDVVCQIYHGQRLKPGISIEHDEYPNPIQSFENRNEALKNVMQSKISLLDMHEELVGMSMSSLFLKRDIDIEFASPIIMEQMLTIKNNVLVTINGLIGDSGMSTAVRFLHTFGSERNRILRSQKDFEMHLRCREIIKGPDKVIINPAHSFMGGFYGIDNREFLPPFFPLFRGEDGLFGILINKCFSGSCMAYLPWLLLHSPNDIRAYEDFNVYKEFKLYPNDIIQSFIEQYSPSKVSDPKSLLRFYGESLRAVGNKPVSEFIFDVKQMRANMITGGLVELKKLLDKYPKSPSYWKKAVLELSDCYEQAGKGKSYEFLPKEIMNAYGYEGGVHFLQKLVGKFGELLTYWPDIVEKTKQLKSKGIELARPV